MRAFLATPEVRPEGVTVSRRRLLAGTGATAVAVAAPVGACPARYVGVPPVVVCMGDPWVNEWLACNDDTREFIETICQGLVYLPSEERKDHLDDLVTRARQITDKKAEDKVRAMERPELIREVDAMAVAANVLEEGGGMTALNYAIASLRAARRRWDEEEFAVGNLNALVLSLSLVGLLLAGLKHPDFDGSQPAESEGGAA